MKTSRTYLFVIFLICGFGSLLLSCGNWEVPTKKTKRECIPPSGSLTTKAQERKVDFSISDAKGTIDQVIWSFGDGSTSVTTGTTVTYTYPNSGTFTASATLTNTCTGRASSSVVVSAFNIMLPSVSIVKPSSASVTTASVNFVVNTYGNPAAVEYGVCYSSSSNIPDDKNSTLLPVATPAVGATRPSICRIWPQAQRIIIELTPNCLQERLFTAHQLKPLRRRLTRLFRTWLPPFHSPINHSWILAAITTMLN